LSRPRFVTLYPTGLTLPVQVLELTWDLERRGFEITLRENGELTVEPRKALTEADQIALTKWHDHIVALTQFCDEVEVT